MIAMQSLAICCVWQALRKRMRAGEQCEFIKSFGDRDSRLAGERAIDDRGAQFR
jgi:hypothetical protein